MSSKNLHSILVHKQGIIFLLKKIDKAEDWTWMHIIAAKKHE